MSLSANGRGEQNNMILIPNNQNDKSMPLILKASPLDELKTYADDLRINNHTRRKG